MQELPIGIQSFEKLRSGNYLYVDKTRQILRLIEYGSVLFLSRPRRFGKSLLVSTLQALFEGRKDLFEGLYIADKVDWEQRYPVIKLDWSNITHTSAGTIERAAMAHLRALAASFDHPDAGIRGGLLERTYPPVASQNRQTGGGAG